MICHGDWKKQIDWFLFHLENVEIKINIFGRGYQKIHWKLGNGSSDNTYPRLFPILKKLWLSMYVCVLDTCMEKGAGYLCIRIFFFWSTCPDQGGGGKGVKPSMRYTVNISIYIYDAVIIWTQSALCIMLRMSISQWLRLSHGRTDGRKFAFNVQKGWNWHDVNVD